jgi:hypothetical protein
VDFPPTELFSPFESVSQNYYFLHLSHSSYFSLQRATLAEKEVTTLKEQIANNTTNNCENKEGSNMDRQTFENEIAAKDKEVSSSFQARIRGGSTFLHLRCRLARVNPQQTNFSFSFLKTHCIYSLQFFYSSRRTIIVICVSRAKTASFSAESEFFGRGAAEA